MKIPNKPFPNYKWRWAEVTPSEGLNNPLRFLGVLRAMYRHQGELKSTNAIFPDLERIQRETNKMTGEKVTLARTGERNLFRNSDRYWKAVGLLHPESRTIDLTPFGKKVAEGKITQTEFAITVIKTLTLPNINIENDISEWRKAKLEIKPLDLILEIIKSLHKNFGETEAYLTPFELQKIIIPLAGDKAKMSDYLEAIEAFRKNKLNVSLFPDCAPGANDKRMVREFLLFLSHYGFCQMIKGENNATDKFFLQSAYVGEISEITTIKDSLTIEKVVEEIRKNPVIVDAERRKIISEIFARPEQSKFRKKVLKEFNNKCFLTGENLSLVLQACHIIPFKHKGSDTVENGLCLRADLHILFDGKQIRFKPDGIVQYSEAIIKSVSYSKLPSRVKFPAFVSKEAVQWRYDYY